MLLEFALRVTSMGKVFHFRIATDWSLGPLRPTVTHPVPKAMGLAN